MLKMEKRMRSRSRLHSKQNEGIHQSILQHVDRYKFRKMGDRKIIGCLNSMENAGIGGTLKDSDYKVAELEVAFKPQQRFRVTAAKSRRTWQCTIRAPRTVMDPITMDVEWKEANTVCFLCAVSCSPKLSF